VRISSLLTLANAVTSALMTLSTRVLPARHITVAGQRVPIPE
jgi:hypothetical protein